jgi:phosphatidylethanolamine-binding protein
MSGTRLHVQYPTGVVTGGQLSILGTATAPTVELDAAAEPRVLLMWDPDSVQPSYIHWLIEIPPGARSATGRVVVPYMGPAPPPGTGQHRYYFAVFEGKAGTLPTARAGFDPRAWQKENNLRWLAWNGFTVQAPTV